MRLNFQLADSRYKIRSYNIYVNGVRKSGGLRETGRVLMGDRLFPVVIRGY